MPKGEDFTQYLLCDRHGITVVTTARYGNCNYGIDKYQIKLVCVNLYSPTDTISNKRAVIACGFVTTFFGFCMCVQSIVFFDVYITMNIRLTLTNLC